MKQLLFAVSLLTMAFCFTACEESEEKVIPEGTADVAIVASDEEVTSQNIGNWTAYAQRVANLLKTDATSLYKAWAEDYKGNGAYAETFKTPSATNSAYRSYSECLQEIIEGCADIANEVGTSKIGEPRDLWESGKYTEAVYAVESWYSFHSIDDYTNNIRSIQNAFYGSRNGQEADHSIASYLRANNPSLYAEVKADIETAINAIQSMAAPFRSHIGNSSILAAQDACATLESVLSNRLKPVMISVDEAELAPIVVNYVDAVVLPTYADLKTKNDALCEAVTALKANPSTATFKAAATAWMEAREPWETSEAFLFGPVAALGLDPNMDSWPLDATALSNILKTGNFGSLEWEGEFDEENDKIGDAQNVRGFHTLEFLLFKDGEARRY